MDTANHHLVVAAGGAKGTDDGLVIQRRRNYYTREQALNLAAWLVALASRDDAAFFHAVQTIRNS